MADLRLDFKTLERAVSFYTPYQKEGQDDGLLVSTEWDEATTGSFRRLTGSDREGVAWRGFYDGIAALARRLAPSMLQALKGVAELKSEMGMPEVMICRDRCRWRCIAIP